MKINTGQIGGGYWGKNLIRALAQLDTLRTIYDSNKNILEKFAGTYPAVNTTTNYKDSLQDPEMYTILIPPPASTHYKIDKEALLVRHESMKNCRKNIKLYYV